MPLMQWTIDLSVGHTEIDDQHKQWIDIYNTAHERITSGAIDRLSSLGHEILHEMIAYTKYHFAFEEEFMEDVEYSGLEDHKLLHDQFAGKLDHLARRSQQGELILNSDIIAMIRQWLFEHIIYEDRKFNIF